MIRLVAFKKAILAGALGAVVWELCFRILHLFLPLKDDMIFTLGTIVFPFREVWKWWTLGMFVHISIGAMWAIFYAYFFWSVIKTRPALQGMIFSLIPSIAAGLSIVPQMAYLHPLILKGTLPAPGFFALKLGIEGPLSIFGFHLIYGMTMGSVYKRPVGYPVSQEKKLLKWRKLSRQNQNRNIKNDFKMPTGDFMFCTGIECSYPTLLNGKWRIDEMELTGHYDHWERDFELVSELGIKYLRYGPPLHWIFKGPDQYDWSFTDAAFAKMQELGITPIIDLCHFGLPAWLGNFQNPEFPKYLAQYAEAMAERYPWIRLWNPVNEMYVAARENALHGTWNEQERSEAAFVRATCNMVHASHLIMNCILKMRPDSIFITSESSEFYQPCCPDKKIVHIADFENQRRFIAMDLLLSISLRDDIKKYMLENGMRESEYENFMKAGMCSHVIMGLDYYPWNEKLVNSKGEIESLGELFGWYVITKQYYERYNRPLFHSETNSMDAERGPDWLWRQWHNLKLLKKEGIPVVGFTWYSLQDQIDWNIGISEVLGNVNPVGLFDLNRDPRSAAIAYRQLLKIFGHENISPPLARELGL